MIAAVVLDRLEQRRAIGNDNRELKQRGRERERERDKTIGLVAEYSHFTWECNHLATFPPSSLETERENFNSQVL